jgi:hypothetical protein
MTDLEVVDAEVEEDNLPAIREAAPVNLFGTDDPSEVIRRATSVADQLKTVLRDQKLITNISGKEHVRVEGWTLLGTMLGVFPVCEWTRQVDNGWEARVEARTLSGAVVGAAEAECLRSEKMWSSRDDYAIRSMAQTRATSKALRQPLGFVVSLAGFDPTPAEEMPSSSGAGFPRDAGSTQTSTGPAPEVRHDNDPLPVPTSWAKITEYASAYDEETYKVFGEFTDAARRRLFPERETMKDLVKHEKDELFKVTARAVYALRENVEVSEFPPPTVEDVRTAWTIAMDGEELAIPRDGDE